MSNMDSLKINVLENKYKIGETGLRPWGEWLVTGIGEGFTAKQIKVNPGEILSLQRHHHREEFWIVIEGKGKITVEDRAFIATLGQEYHIPKGAWHRIENVGEVQMIFNEVQKGAILDEADIERKEDKYSRVEVNLPRENELEQGDEAVASATKKSN